MQKTNKYIAVVFLLLLAVSLLLTMFVGGVGMAHASTTDNNSYVLYDLQNDSKFNELDYPEKTGDYSLEVIGIAESVDDELFVYVYQPSGKTVDLRATSINISKGYKTLDFKIYNLTFCNSHKTLYKYKVDKFQVEDTRTRYYDITTIRRAFNKDYGDKGTGNDNTISEVPFSVSKIYKFTVENGEFVVETRDTDTIRVLSKYVGFVRYTNGFLGIKSSCDSHFVAFSTDISIDKLTEADIYYCKQSYSYDSYDVLSPDTFGEVEEKYSYVTDKQDIQYELKVLWNKDTICRDRIQTVDDFIASEDFEYVYECGIFDVKIESKISEKGISNLKDCKWVVRFAETPYQYYLTGGYAPRKRVNYEIVSDVSVLRLEGISDGEPFNLGVVDNKQSGGRDPINDWDVTVTGADIDLLRVFKIVLAILCFIVLIILVVCFVRFVVTPVKTANKFVKIFKRKNKK